MSPTQDVRPVQRNRYAWGGHGPRAHQLHRFFLLLGGGVPPHDLLGGVLYVLWIRSQASV